MLLASEFPSRLAAVSSDQKGLFAATALAPGTVVARFEGPVMPWREVPAETVRHALLVEADRWLVPSSEARFVNHSCDPNCTVDDALAVVTTRAVAAGEELTFSYDTLTMAEWVAAPAAYFWDERWSFDCRCGAPGCVGRVDRYRIRGWENGTPAVAATKVRLAAIPGKGRGVVAVAAIAAGEVIERAPVIVSSDHEWPQLEKTALYHYVFEWGPQDQHSAIALGYGSIYNHSYDPNAAYELHLDDLLVGIVARRAIAAGEEITTNYNRDPGDRAPVWFEVQET